VARGSIWYLVADKGELRRTYRVSRIRDAAVLDTAGRRPADFDLAAHWERAASEFRDKLPRYYATFVAEPSVMPWVRYRGWRLEEETSSGERFRIRVRFDAEEEALQFALSFGPAIEVLEPALLRDRVIDAAAAVVRAAGGARR
jgi:predicted DNA-binding transcriptional regulator YafY